MKISEVPERVVERPAGFRVVAKGHTSKYARKRVVEGGGKREAKGVDGPRPRLREYLTSSTIQVA